MTGGGDDKQNARGQLFVVRDDVINMPSLIVCLVMLSLSYSSDDDSLIVVDQCQIKM